MKRKFTILAGTTSVILSLVSQPALAVWSGPQGLGGTYVSNPSCASLGTNQVICAGLGTDNSLFVNASDPSCARLGTSKVICAGLGTDNSLFVNTGP